MSRKIFILIGPPASGKGTQAEMLSKKIKLPVVSAGDLLRYEEKAKSKIGKQASSIMSAGKLVPNEVVFKLLKKRSLKPDAKKGYIIDGFPRSKGQLDYLPKLVKKEDIVYAIEIMVNDKEVKSRINGRRVCKCGAAYHLKYKPSKKDGICDKCGKRIYIRDDDKPRVVSKRLKVYHKNSKSVLNYFIKIDKLIKVNGDQPIIKVHKDLIKEVKKIYDQID
ncbi:MAG: nucleoside monophosphate kinase [bacterium]